MKNLLFSVFVLLFSTQSLWGQAATISDPDGWTNVRKEPKGESEVIHVVHEGEFFFWASPEMDMDPESEWAEVYIPTNKFSLEDGGSSPTIKGYIHRSRILPIEEIPEYKGSDFSFAYATSAFKTEGKVIEYLDGEVHRINGRQIYGTDLSTPGDQVDGISVFVGSEKIEIHPVFYQDIFECDNEFSVHKIGELFILNQWNSDGAGAYEIVWVIDKTGVVQRLVGTLY